MTSQTGSSSRSAGPPRAPAPRRGARLARDPRVDALRGRRDAVLDAFLAGPCGLARRQRHARRRARGRAQRSHSRLPVAHRCGGALSSPPMRRAARFALSPLIALPVGLAGCGGGEETSPTPETVEGTLPGRDDGRGGAADLDTRRRRVERREGLRLGGLRRLPHARGRRLVRQRRPQPRRREARSRARDQPGHERRGRDALVQGPAQRAGDRRRRPVRRRVDAGLKLPRLSRARSPRSRATSTAR